MGEYGHFEFLGFRLHQQGSLAREGPPKGHWPVIILGLWHSTKGMQEPMAYGSARLCATQKRKCRSSGRSKIDDNSGKHRCLQAPSCSPPPLHCHVVMDADMSTKTMFTAHALYPPSPPHPQLLIIQRRPYITYIHHLCHLKTCS